MYIDAGKENQTPESLWTAQATQAMVRCSCGQEQVQDLTATHGTSMMLLGTAQLSQEWDQYIDWVITEGDITVTKVTKREEHALEGGQTYYCGNFPLAIMQALQDPAAGNIDISKVDSVQIIEERAEESYAIPGTQLFFGIGIGVTS